MKPIPAIVEPAESEVALAAVRSSSSALREAEVQVEKIGKRLEAAEGAVALRKLELGRALNAAHELWPSTKAAQGGARGPRGQTWEQFLESEGIAKSTAYQLMKDAGGSSERRDPGRPVDRSGPRRVPDPPHAFALLPGFDLRLGRWQDTLAKIGVVDTLISDPPFGAKTHTNSRALGNAREDGSPLDGIGPDYQPWTAKDVMQFVCDWSPRVRGWMACMTSHDLIGPYQDAYEAAGRYSFAPVPIVLRGMSLRVSGDGPSSWAVYLMVARPRSEAFSRWGTLPGAYVHNASPNASKGRGKPAELLEEIVGHYSREGDLVCDPLAGRGSTLFAALKLGRRAIGAELDPEAHAAATAAAKQPID